MPNRILISTLTFILLFASSASWADACRGQFFNPITDVNWSNALPITIANVPIGGADQPPVVYEPPICICPSHIPPFPPVPGVGLTYWEPLYMVEQVNAAGCLPTLGGIEIGGFSILSGPAGTSGSHGGPGIGRSQTHFYKYPLFALLDMFSDMVCVNSSKGFNLAYITEVDPIWQNDLWSNLLNPESILFNNPIAQAACMVDAVAAAVSYPLDALFWCSGSWGSMYPFSGTPTSVHSDQQANSLVAAKFLARQARTGMMWTTVGPQAICFSTPSAIVVKNQYRFNQVYPNPVQGNPVYMGQTEFRWGYAPPANYPSGQDSAFLIWEAHQCCLRP